MKLSKLLAASLTMLSVLAVGSSAQANNPAKRNGNNGSDTVISNGTTYVFAAECGTDPLTQASFSPTGGMPLSAVVNEVTTLTGGYAGALIFTPVAGLDITSLPTFTSFLNQGTFTQTAGFVPGLYTSGNPILEQAVAYRWKTKNGNDRFGVSFIPTSQINGTQQFTNQALKGKSFQLTVTSNTNLQALADAKLLFNLIGNDPGDKANSFLLIGIASALTNEGAAGTSAAATFNDFQINGVYQAKAIGPSNNINCTPLLQNLTPAAAAANKTR